MSRNEDDGASRVEQSSGLFVMPGTITDPEQGPPDLDDITLPDDERETLSGDEGETVGSRISESQAARGRKTNTAYTHDAQIFASQDRSSHRRQSIPMYEDNDRVGADGYGGTRQSRSHGSTRPKMDTVVQKSSTSPAHASRKKKKFRHYHHQDESPTGHPRICTGKWGNKRHPPSREDSSHRPSCLSLAGGLSRLLGFDQPAIQQSWIHGQTK